MSRRCPRCRRPNPTEAVYCYQDGFVLEGRGGGDVPADGSAMNIGARPFTVPLVLPTGSQCTNFVQLVSEFLEHPEVMKELLCQGKIENFLAGQGRADLAVAAHAARHAGNRERGLDDFLGRLPVPLGAARLEVRPEVLDLGMVQVGADREAVITLVNKGMRLLYGVAGSPAPWLALSNLPALKNKSFQFQSRLCPQGPRPGQGARRYDKPREGEIQIESNGGARTVLVRLQVPVQPFPEGVLAGAMSPREAAHKAKAAPKEAGALIDNGGRAALVSVQRLGLSGARTGRHRPCRPAAVLRGAWPGQTTRGGVSEDQIVLQGRPGDKVEHILAVITQENRNVVAHGVSDQPWLVVGQPVFRGRSAFLPLTVSAVPGAPGQTFQARITVTANGGRQLTAQLTLQVIDSARPRPRGCSCSWRMHRRRVRANRSSAGALSVGRTWPDDPVVCGRALADDDVTAGRATAGLRNGLLLPANRRDVDDRAPDNGIRFRIADDKRVLEQHNGFGVCDAVSLAA